MSRVGDEIMVIPWVITPQDTLGSADMVDDFKMRVPIARGSHIRLGKVL